jgi:rhodanese-related sulfurtransferase
MTVSDLPDPLDGEELDVAEVLALKPRIDAGEIRLIDCRELDEWDFAHLEAAEWFPLSNFAIAAVALVDSGTPCVVYCHHGMRSLTAARWLRERGLERAWSMKGGIDAWAIAVDPRQPRY